MTRELVFRILFDRDSNLLAGTVRSCAHKGADRAGNFTLASDYSSHIGSSNVKMVNNGTFFIGLINSYGNSILILNKAACDYSKQFFGLNYPLLARTDGAYDPVRYYSKPLTIDGVTYKLCSQWFETAANNDRPYLLKWINEHSSKI